VQSLIKKSLLAFVLLFNSIEANAGDSEKSLSELALDKSFIAIAPDKELCTGSKGYFVPLPTVDSEDEASNSYLKLLINDEIDKQFSTSCKLNGLLLKGKITEATLPQIQLGLQLLESRRNNSSIDANTLWLDSPGGLITEAIKIGDVIAEKNMEAIVTFSGHCYSACVLIYAAARTRSGIGNVGIHRPFASEISTNLLSYPEYLKKYDALTPILTHL
jgi:membrane-bound ClpP family serine protease